MEQQVKIFDTSWELSEYFASLLVLKIPEAGDGRFFSWVLSGGSTPKIIFSKLAAEFRDIPGWPRIKVFWGDERCVGPADEQSNYKMARETLLDHLPVNLSGIFRIKGENDPAGEAKRYSEVFKREVNFNQGVPSADLLMLGLGEDGHTASIFPDNIDLFSSTALFEQVEHPVTKQKRITATGKIINNAKLIIILATGTGKAEKVAQILNKLNGWEQLPAGRVKPEHGQLIWLLDRQAASKLQV